MSSIFSEEMELTPTSTPVLNNPMHSKDKTVQYMRDVTLMAISQIVWCRELCPRTEFKQKVLLGRTFNILQSSEDTGVKYMVENMAGAFEAMNRRYLKSISMIIKDETGKFVLESYTITYSYDKNKSPMCLDISSGCSSAGSSSVHISTPVGLTQLYKKTSDLLQRLEESSTFLEPLPERSLLDFRLSYYEYTPRDFIPSGFRFFTEEELRKADLFQEEPLKLRQGRIENEFGAIGISTKFTSSLLRHSELNTDSLHLNDS